MVGAGRESDERISQKGEKRIGVRTDERGQSVDGQQRALAWLRRYPTRRSDDRASDDREAHAGTPAERRSHDYRISDAGVQSAECWAAQRDLVPLYRFAAVNDRRVGVPPYAFHGEHRHERAADVDRAVRSDRQVVDPRDGLQCVNPVSKVGARPEVRRELIPLDAV
jgi:hypothetical protein